VVECDPGRLFHIRVVEGPPVDGRWEFVPTPAGTRVTFRPLANRSGGAPIANRAMEQMTALVFRRFHRRLKRVLEQEGKPGSPPVGAESDGRSSSGAAATARSMPRGRLGYSLTLA
jgi:hypothetical protein